MKKFAIVQDGVIVNIAVSEAPLEDNWFEVTGNEGIGSTQQPDGSWKAPEPVPPTEEEIRQQRDRLLKECDWTQVADAPVDQAAWATYRQALRDIPQQEGFPENVVWPEKP